ncbi:N-lysine methyltransferase KMT5A-like [Tubulanus polymorphus]|uniref:N-lysine methyltransferase KMT5A-like n=1 Tax=Tubulanus polymorphus TaxID=672921 RepID=UPI003DA3A87B
MDVRKNKRVNPQKMAVKYFFENCDPPGFCIEQFEGKGRGVVTVQERKCGDFLLNYVGDLVSENVGSIREDLLSSGFRFFFQWKGKKFW